MGNTSIADLPPHIQAQVRKQIEAQNEAQRIYNQAMSEQHAPKRKSKFNNTRTPYKSVQGFERIYDSKGEAKYANLLDIGIQAGVVKWWLPQVPIPLPGGVKLVVDFLVQWADRLAFVDFKGVLTREAANKIKQAKSCLGIDVELVRK